MYFPGDPLFPYDPIFTSVRDERARERMISRFSIDSSQENWALAYEFDIVLGGRDGTPIEEAR
jgi:protocatechuate 3,4-dioxygenase beta subunit